MTTPWTSCRAASSTTEPKWWEQLKRNKKIGNQTKTSVNENRRLIKSGKQLISDLNLEDNEKTSIFDLIASENPDF